GGLYDRFLFGVMPPKFLWSYRPFPSSHPMLVNGSLPLKPGQVLIDPSVWEVTKEWNQKDPSLGRIVEVCTRVATIFASIDGRSLVTAEDLQKMWPLAVYQKAVREAYKPNPGVNPDAMYANSALAWIKGNAKNWRTVRDLQTGTNFFRKKLGPTVCYRALLGLEKSGEIEVWTSRVVEDDRG